MNSKQQAAPLLRFSWQIAALCVLMPPGGVSCEKRERSPATAPVVPAAVLPADLLKKNAAPPRKDAAFIGKVTEWKVDHTRAPRRGFELSVDIVEPLYGTRGYITVQMHTGSLARTFGTGGKDAASGAGTYLFHLEEDISADYRGAAQTWRREGDGWREAGGLP